MKRLILFLMWLSASAAALGVAWAGVSVVNNQVVDPPSVAKVASPPDIGATGSSGGGEATRPAADLELISTGSAGQAENFETAGPEESSRSTRSTSSSPATSSTSERQAAPPPTTASITQSVPTSQPSTTSKPLPTSPSSTTSQTSSTSQPSPTTSPSTPTSAAPPPPPAATVQTFTLIGGTAAISFSPTGVEVLWATPNPGFSVKIEPESPGLKVEFRADHHRSRVDAWWSGGPRSSTREEPRD